MISWPVILAISIIPALLATWIVRHHYLNVLEDRRLDHHIEMMALQNRTKLQIEILHDRLNEETRAHLHTINLLAKVDPVDGITDSDLSLEESLRPKL